jgi:hypothetical protein
LFLIIIKAIIVNNYLKLNSYITKIFRKIV